MGFFFAACSLGPWKGASVENEIKDISFFAFVVFVFVQTFCIATNIFLSRKVPVKIKCVRSLCFCVAI